MYLLRVILPDRPGSLGAVARALGEAHADIASVEIIEKAAGLVIDDFMVDLPDGVRPDTLVSACSSLPDVEVMWVSFYPQNRTLTADVDVLDAMLAHPDAASEVLADAAPSTFHCTWAALVESATGDLVHRTTLAPPGSLPVHLLGDLGVAHTAELPTDFCEGWGEQIVAVVPCRAGRALVLGRPGPEFRASELARLRHLAMLAADRESLAAVNPVLS
ncbi:ACT domain-containing protein [Propioniciclava coleopterorum]|uniref:ACT domain-containing protein n=1 Tax=Propioniciclava coleopterorum TaxID=2714937 RepID=A0A6G7YAE9_9ACTN|nr:ACT domain-containing protein [Propioniciclava coleopterorum]QIK73621.1 ACT domain-containing protein [Propioniciclava coleopterorum]